jgi:hypothetical protein
MKPEDTFLSCSSDDDAPEAISMSTTKSSIVEQMKREKQATLSIKEKRRAVDQSRREQAEAKKKQIEAAMADFVNKAAADKNSRDLKQQQETKVIKFESEDEEEAESESHLPDGSKIILLNEPTSLLTKRISGNRTAMLKTKQRLATNPLIKRVAVSSKVNKKRTSAPPVAMVGRENVGNKNFRLSSFSL